MTEYFDIAAQQLVSIRKAFGGTQSTKYGEEMRRRRANEVAVQLDRLDSRLCWDVSVCTEFPGFPEDIQQEVNRAILKWSTTCQPIDQPGPVYETVEDHIRGLIELNAMLHTLFHVVAERNIKGFGDDPRIPLRILYSRADVRREYLAGERRADTTT